MLLLLSETVWSPPCQIILEVEGTAEQAGLMKDKRRRDAAFIERHKLLKRLAGSRVPGEAALGKEEHAEAVRTAAAGAAGAWVRARGRGGQGAWGTWGAWGRGS